VEALEQEAAEGNLTNTLVYFSTDNTMVESCLYKGNSSSVKLFRLMVRMRNLEMTQALVESCRLLLYSLEYVVVT
jgi:hypothetical protein